jgi:hypothetical protein
LADELPHVVLDPMQIRLGDHADVREPLRPKTIENVPRRVDRGGILHVDREAVAFQVGQLDERANILVAGTLVEQEAHLAQLDGDGRVQTLLLDRRENGFDLASVRVGFVQASDVLAEQVRRAREPAGVEDADLVDRVREALSRDIAA